MYEQELENHWKEIFNLLPPLASREQVSAVIGGIIAPRTLANKDCEGSGINNRRMIGKKVCYPRADVIRWLMEQEKIIEYNLN